MSSIFDPFQELLMMQELLQRALRQVEGPSHRRERGGTGWSPVADVVKTPADFVIHVELPGIPRDTVRLQVEGSELVLTGLRPKTEEIKEGRFRRMEGEYGEFKRSFTLPDDGDVDHVEATLTAGVLEIRIPLRGRGGACGGEIEIA